jgi:hypothetical protein
VKTSTVKAGAPDSIKISSAGSIVPPVGAGAAVTVDSSHGVSNEGAISITDSSNATGILANPGVSASISNSGKIEVVEAFTATDTDNDGDLDGPFAQGSNRFGIRVAPGGTLTGNIANSGTITVEGNDSRGISVESKLAGNLTVSGAIGVTGDRGVGIRTGDVTGNVQMTNGATAVQGKESVGIALMGDIGGSVSLQGAVSSTGYRTSVPPADSSKLDADDLLQGGAAVHIAGNVAKGVILDVRPKDNSTTDNDEDKDGIPDANEGNGSIASLGAAPALLIGASDRAVEIGALAGTANNGHGLVINGSVTGQGVYTGVGGSGLVVGGLGGAVNVAGGMSVNGTVGASSNGATAAAVRIGSGATVNEIRVTGTVESLSGKTATSAAWGLVVDQGGTVTTVRNSGKITAGAAEAGSAAAIVDNGGKISLIENSGTIAANGVALDTGRAVAIDLRANANGATVRQFAGATGAAAPQITGNLLFGGGNDVLEVGAGQVTGNASFGAGADKLALSGSSIFAGNADFGGGADLLTLAGTSRFTGAITNASGLAVQVNGGTLVATNGGAVPIASLSVGSGGTLGVSIDAAGNKTTLYQVAGAASFAQGSKLQVNLLNVSQSEGAFTVLKAGTLTGTAGISANAVVLPVFFKSSLASNEAAGELKIQIARKTSAELGLNKSEAGAWDAVFKALDKDGKVAGAFLSMTEGEAFRAALQQMLPEHAGGAFEAVTQGSRATARFLRDPGAPFADQGGWGFWLQQVGWGTSKDLGDTSEYDIAGWGAAGGAEVKLGGFGSAGLSLAFLNGRDTGGGSSEVRADQYELGAYWRAEWAGLRAHARASAAMINFNGERTFTATVGSETVTRTARGEWDGKLYSASGGVSYELPLGTRLSVRPGVFVDYYRLQEDGYSETGGGNAFDLIVEDRSSDEFAGEASLTLGYDFMSRDRREGWLRAELEGGRRQILGGQLGATTARFGTGNPFTLLPESRADGWLGRLRLAGGNGDFSLGGELGAEEQQGRAAVSGRITLQFGF